MKQLRMAGSCIAVWRILLVTLATAACTASTGKGSIGVLVKLIMAGKTRLEKSSTVHI